MIWLVVVMVPGFQYRYEPMLYHHGAIEALKKSINVEKLIKVEAKDKEEAIIIAKRLYKLISTKNKTAIHIEKIENALKEANCVKKKPLVFLV